MQQGWKAKRASARPIAVGIGIGIAIAFLIALPPGSARAAEPGENPDLPSAFRTEIDARRYDDRLETLEDVLDRVPGLRVRRSGGLGSRSTVSIRGSKPEQVLVLLDGARLNSSYSGDVDLATIPLRTVGRIEVLRGAGASRFGSDAIGGVISIESRDAAPGRGVDLSAATGRHHTLGGDALLWSDTGPWRGSAVYSRLRSRNDFRFDQLPESVSLDSGSGGRLPPGLPRGRSGQAGAQRFTRLNADFLSESALGRVGWRGAPGGTRAAGAGLDATLELHRKDNGQPGTANGPGNDDDDKSYTAAQEQYRRAFGRVRWRRRRIGPGALELGAHGRVERHELRDTGGRFLFATVLDPALRPHRFETLESSVGIDAVYQMRTLALGPADFRTRLSAELRLDRLRLRDDDPKRDFGDPKRRRVGRVAALGELSLLDGRLRVFPTTAFETADTSAGRVRDVESLGVRSVDARPLDRGEWLPHLGMVFEVVPGLRLKANYLRAYRRPDFVELFHPDWSFVRGNPRLEAEASWNFDAGFELAGDGAGPLRELRLSAAWFHRDIDESIEWVLAGTTLLPQNTGEATARGWELAGSVELWERLELDAAYSSTDTEVRSTGRALPHAPRNRWSLHATLRPLPGVRVFAQYAWEDEYATGFSGRVRAPRTRRVDLGFALRPAAWRPLRWLPQGLTVSSEWTNLSGEQAFDSLGTPLPGQSLWTLRARIGARR